jgi:hypothetical protein
MVSRLDPEEASHSTSRIFLLACGARSIKQLAIDGSDEEQMVRNQQECHPRKTSALYNRIIEEKMAYTTVGR